MTTTTERPLSSAPVDAKITDEAIAAARAMIGVRLRPEGPFLQDVTPDTIRNFCNGIGDLNPLYRDLEYGRLTQYGTMIAHPMLPMMYGWIGRTRWGLPGVHGFYAGNDWELFRHYRPGDRITCIERIVGVEEKESKFSGRLVLQYVEASFMNQHDDLVARVLGWCTRHERQAAREKGKYKDITAYEYSAEELAAIDKAVLDEDVRIRGKVIRTWEETSAGDELEPIARGPLSMMDTMGFCVGCGRGHTHGLVLKNAVRHPGHFFRNPEAGGGVEYTGIGHHRDSVAKQVGVPGTYDYGPQRSAWLCTLVTNWIGDAGFLKRIRTELRRFNTMGDTTWCRGVVAKKYRKDGYALLDIDVRAENQRGETTATGMATVVLPSTDASSVVANDGAGLSLDLPQIR